MTDRRFFRSASTSARLLAGTLVSIGFVIAIVTTISVPWPTLAREPVAITASPAASQSVVVCTGGLLALGREQLDVARLVTAAPQTVVSGGQAGDPPPVAVPLAPAAPDGVAPATAVVAEPVEGGRSDVTASGSSSVAAEDLSGFAASACRAPMMESWLVGGSAVTGATDLVLLANPGSVTATVQLTVFGASGPQVPAGGTDLIVGPGTQIALPLAGLQLGEASPVIRVTATGAPVQAALQTSITRTLVPGGVDQVGAIAAPDTVQTMPGVTVTQNPGAEGPAATVVRILSPDADTTATITASGIGAAQPVAVPTSVPLSAGIPVEVELGGLAAGSYSIEVTAETSVVAAVWQTTGFGAGSDFAWYTPAPQVTGAALFATPPGPTPVLTLVNPTAEPVTVTVTAVDGALTTEVTVPAGERATARLESQSVYLLVAGGGGIRAGLSLSGDGALAGFPVWPSDATAQQITVYP